MLVHVFKKNYPPHPLGKNLGGEMLNHNFSGRELKNYQRGGKGGTSANDHICFLYSDACIGGKRWRRKEAWMGRLKHEGNPLETSITKVVV